MIGVIFLVANNFNFNDFCNFNVSAKVSVLRTSLEFDLTVHNESYLLLFSLFLLVHSRHRPDMDTFVTTLFVQLQL